MPSKLNAVYFEYQCDMQACGVDAWCKKKTWYMKRKSTMGQSGSKQEDRQGTGKASPNGKNGKHIAFLDDLLDVKNHNTDDSRICSTIGKYQFPIYILTLRGDAKRHERLQEEFRDIFLDGGVGGVGGDAVGGGGAVGGGVGVGVGGGMERFLFTA